MALSRILLRQHRYVTEASVCLFVLAAGTWLQPSLVAQTKYYTATHSVRLQEFGTFAYVAPGYRNPSTAPGVDFGATGGVNLDFATHIWLNPGLELRATVAGGPVSDQYSYGGGPRLIAPLHHVQPYANFLFGSGAIRFPSTADPSYHGDTSNVYSFGGGADVLLKRGWAVRIDVQSQRWRLSRNNEPFHPLLVTAGLRYELHGGKHSPQR